ncbi:MAG: polymer-forming cytoskeletal protein [Rhodospirillales bacterium]|nr:polymer-forming cytoskeletal protein [Rhodospirillales bacterium]
MDRRQQSERSEAAADDVTDARDSDFDPEEARDEATVAHRLSRVTRYATGGTAKSEPDQEERQDPTSEKAPLPDPAPAEEPHPESEDAQNGTETAEAMPEEPGLVEEPEPEAILEAREEPVLVEEPEPEPVLAEEAEPGPAFAEEAQPEPAPDGGPPQTAAPTEEALQDHAAFEEEQPDPTPRETASEELVFSDIAEHLGIAEPSPSGPEAAEAAPVAVADEQQPPEALHNQEEGPPAGAPEQPAAVAETPAPTAETGPNDGEVLTVGRGIRLVAKLCECAELLVEGHLEATARTQQLQLAKSGRFIGSAEVEYAEIHGQYEGELTVSKKLYIAPTGSVSGTTHYREIVIEAGGQIMGNTHHLPDEGEAGAGA